MAGVDKSFSNQEVARLLREVVAAYEVRGESFFKIRAYDNAADAVEHASSAVKDLWDDGKLSSLPGVGKAIASYLDELFRAGEVKHFQEVKQGLPKGMFSLLDIPGVGPKSAYKLAKELKIQSVEELKEAAEAGKVREVSGFGEVLEQEILRGIENLDRQTGRMLLPRADKLAERVIPKLRAVPGVVRVDPSGSLRRRVSTIGDLDLAVAVKSSDQSSAVIEKFVNLAGAAEVIEQGDNKASLIWGNGKRIDLRVQTEESYGALLQHLTGSKAHNIHLREIAQKKDFSLSEYGIKKEKNGKIVKFRVEKDFYDFLGLDWIPPELREDSGEIEAAAEGKLPKLVKLSDIKGDLHLHCDFDLEESHDPGRSPMVEYAKKASRLGYEYVSIGNHNPSVYNHSEKEIVELIKAKQRKIEKAQKKFPELKLLNEVEVDILADSSLAIPDAGLRFLDLVVVSIHSALRQSREKLTRRVVAALENPYTHILGHPTGRLLNQREGYELDWERVFATAKKHNKAIEINAFYNRLDLPDVLVREAVGKGVKLIVNTDAHEVSQMENMGYGVSVARRGWAEADDILNTLGWGEFREWLEASHFVNF